MRGVIMNAPGDVRVEERPDPVLEEATDAIIRVTATCVCGSDGLIAAVMMWKSIPWAMNTSALWNRLVMM